MFDKKIYIERRNQLKKDVQSGLVLLLGNKEVAFNYPANTYSFRQDSNFLYFFGLHDADLAGVIDIDNQKDFIFGNDVDMDDIIWMGNQPSVKEEAKIGFITKFFIIITPIFVLADVISDILVLSKYYDD